MPHYDYRCEKCGEFEIYQSIKDDALKNCIKCGSEVNRIIRAAIVIDKTPRTFGSLAEKNTKALGVGQSEREAVAKANRPTPPPWRPDMDRPDININKFTQTEVEKYIMEGVRPIGK